jgi:hypothetical protein
MSGVWTVQREDLQWYATDPDALRDFIVTNIYGSGWTRQMVFGGTHWKNFLIAPRMQLRLL